MSPSCWLRTTADSCSWRRKVNPDKHGVLLSCCWAWSPVWGVFLCPAQPSVWFFSSPGCYNYLYRMKALDAIRTSGEGQRRGGGAGRKQGCVGQRLGCAWRAAVVKPPWLCSGIGSN